MPATQLVEAISRGVIDGTITHPIVVEDFGITRVTNNHYFGKVGAITGAIFMNKKKFDSLPTSVKAIIDAQSGEKLSRLYGETTDRMTKEVIEKWSKDPKRTVTVPTKEDETIWNNLLAPVVTSWENKNDQNRKIAAALREQLGEIRAGR